MSTVENQDKLMDEVEIPKVFLLHFYKVNEVEGAHIAFNTCDVVCRYKNEQIATTEQWMKIGQLLHDGWHREVSDLLAQTVGKEYSLENDFDFSAKLIGKIAEVTLDDSLEKVSSVQLLD